ncbi:MAG: branched-chain amino acid ABC transporter permease [Ruminococcaceae bacterium]|nr:branched-chain amino acid ABC transporter permease [Oscillospiraceae bacterium]
MNIQQGKKKLPLALAFAALVLALPFIIQAIVGNDYWVLITCTMLVYIIAVSGLDILFGYSGQISLGHAAFFVIGAYTTGMLNNYFNIPLYITIPTGAVLAAAIGALLAYPASKLKFHFLSLATIAFGEITFNLLYVSPGGVTGDYLGIKVINIPFLHSYQSWYYFLLIFVVVGMLLKQSLVNSRVGRAFMAIRENTNAADGMGVNVHKYKIVAFAVSAFYTGLAGAIFIHLYRYMSPETAMQNQSVSFLTMLLFGGTASLAGPIIGVVIISIMMELIRPLQEYQMLFFGILLLIVIVALPGGIYGGIQDLMISIKKRKLHKAAAGSSRKDGE